MDKYKVIKTIAEEDSWKVGAEVGEILIVRTWLSALTLMKGDKAVCDLNSEIATESCEHITN